MKTSAVGRAAITAREGRRLVAYRDTQGVLTIGVGHTGRMAPPPVTAGMTITDAQCDAFLAADLVPVEAAINAVLKRPVTQNQFDALASFLFNVGVGWAGVGGHAPASIFTRLNAGDIAGAASGFDLFHIPAAIIGRRNSEKAQFLRPDAPAAAAAPVPTLPTIAPTPAPAGATPPATPAPPPAAPSPAPQSASQPATTESKPMTTAAATSTAAIQAAVPNVNFFQGALNTVEHWIGTLTGGLAAAKDPTNTKVSTTPGSTGFFGTIQDIEAAVGKLGEIKSDFANKDIQEGVADGVDLLTLGFATLATFGINLPVVSTIFAEGLNVHAGGVDKPA